MDITQLILDDHHEQRRLFAILEQIDRSDTDTLGAVWSRLAAFLELHAAAEEELFCFRLKEHFVRLRESLKMNRFDVPYSETDLFEAVRETLRGNQIREDVHMHLVAYVGGVGVDASDQHNEYRRQQECWIQPNVIDRNERGYVSIGIRDARTRAKRT